MSRSRALIVLAVILAACARAPEPVPAPPAPTPTPASATAPTAAGRAMTSADVAAFHGDALHAVLSRPDRVTVYRIVSNRAASDSAATIAGYPIITGPVASSAEDATAFAAMVTGPAGYHDLRRRIETPGAPPAPGCAFRPGICAVVERGGRSAQVLICFACSEWRLLPTDGGEPLSDHFLAIHADLRALAGRWFPNDSAFRPAAR